MLKLNGDSIGGRVELRFVNKVELLIGDRVELCYSMAETTTNDKWSIDKLEGPNWSTWKFQMKHMLLAKGLWGHVDGSETIGEDATPGQNQTRRRVRS